ncbi:MAG TPA: M28 family metallopeptidase [Candidatus Acidoferrales bacterium]|nr:M28 family metallopeptidase [Candidatus Acidoferrales bacterium]
MFDPPRSAISLGPALQPAASRAADSLRAWRTQLFWAFCAAVILLLAVMRGAAEDAEGIAGFRAARVSGERQLEARLKKVPDPVHAEQNLRHLTSEPHMAGTEASRRVAEWLRDQYHSFGFEAEIVSYTAWMPEPREAKLELTEPENRTLASPEQPIAVDQDTHDKRAVAAFNSYSPSADVRAPVVYVNYGNRSDYEQLAQLGVNVEGKIVMARYGHGYRGIKVKLAEEHRAAAVILYSDPYDDGAVAGPTYPNGPWRPLSGIQRGSILYTEIYPGDPLTPGGAATPSAPRLRPADAANLPRIPAMPINAQDAAVILGHLGGVVAPASWQGGLPLSYHVGPGAAEVHMKLLMDYKERPLYNVVARLRGIEDDEWVILGNHHDAWVYGAADPGSGTASLLEAARALGALAKSGWKPRRTLVICQWDGEEEGLLGSTEWVEANVSELQQKAVAYINTDIGVDGPNFEASAVPSLKDLVRDVTRAVEDPKTGRSVHEAWVDSATLEQKNPSGLRRQPLPPDPFGKVPLGALGSGSDFSAFLDHAGIPSVDLGFAGPYGVYHSLYDDFYWMKHFGDPTFSYHVALAQILAILALRLDEADILPFNYPAYALEIEHAATDAFTKTTNQQDQDALEATLDAAAHLSASAHRASEALRAISDAPLDPTQASQINHALAGVEQALLAPNGLTGRPWFKHTIYAPGSYEGYSATPIPGENDALVAKDSETLRREANVLSEALLRASSELDVIAETARTARRPQVLDGQ